jgi:pimeloyl-ACP methyl ester carboxylesterase
MHDASCWDRVVKALDEAGHPAVAPDLPGHGHRRGGPASLDAYADAVVDVAEPGDVLVGHSMGGVVAIAAAARLAGTPAHVVVIASIVPEEGQSAYAATPALEAGEILDVTREGFIVRDFDAYHRIYCHDAPEPEARSAFGRLVRESHVPYREPLRAAPFWANDVPRDYIACLDDRTGVLKAVEDSARRLGITAVRPFAASHSPFLSRPADLASLLIETCS